MSTDDVGSSSLSSWQSRPKRQRKAPVRYWEEFVETDTWYQQKLLEDVPADEMHAACFDENFSDDVNSEDTQESDEESGMSFVSGECEELSDEYKTQDEETESSDEASSLSSEAEEEV